MLEIIAIIALSKKIGDMVKEKGYPRGWFIALTVLLWVGGEIAGAIAGTVLGAVFETSQCVVYIFALAGAACGAVIAYLTAASLPDKSPAPADAVDVPALDLSGE